MTWEVVIKPTGDVGGFKELIQQFGHFGLKIRGGGNNFELRAYTWGSPEPKVSLRTLNPQSFSQIVVVYAEEATHIYENGDLTATVDNGGKKNLGDAAVWLFPGSAHGSVPPLSVARVRMWPKALDAGAVKSLAGGDDKAGGESQVLFGPDLSEEEKLARAKLTQAKLAQAEQALEREKMMAAKCIEKSFGQLDRPAPPENLPGGGFQGGVSTGSSSKSHTPVGSTHSTSSTRARTLGHASSGSQARWSLKMWRAGLQTKAFGWKAREHTILDPRERS